MSTTNGAVPTTNAASAPPMYTSARDFRSDTVTTPSPSMIAAMSSAIVGDDVYLEDPTTTAFEAYVTKLVGYDATNGGGLFVQSGTLGNQLALRTHLLQPPHSLLCDSRAHIRNYEAGAAAALSQVHIIGVMPTNGVYLTLEDVEEHAMLSDDIHFAPTKLICLENTLGGTIMPLAEAQRISKWARERGIKIHLDGARLWNAVAAGAGTLKEYAACFDSMSLCLSKGLGAPIGSILVSTSGPFVLRARHIRKMLGGGMRQTGLLTAAAHVALTENFPTKLAKTHEVAKYIESALGNMGLKMLQPVDTSMLFVDLKSAGVRPEWIQEEAAKHAIRMGGGERIVVHWQIEDDAVAALLEVFRTVLQKMADGELVAEGAKKPRVTYGSV